LEILLFLLLAFGTALRVNAEKMSLRVGHFPNVTQAQAMIAHGFEPCGEGMVRGAAWAGRGSAVVRSTRRAERDGSDIRTLKLIFHICWSPNPAVKRAPETQGEESAFCRAPAVVAALVVQPDGRIQNGQHGFSKARKAPPNLVNYAACGRRERGCVKRGLRITMTSGRRRFVVPTANPDQLTLFQKGEMDAGVGLSSRG